MDVSGSNGVPPPGVDLDVINHQSNVTLIHLKDRLHTPTPTPLGYIDDEEDAEMDNDLDLDDLKVTASDKNASSTMDLVPTKPVVLYIWREYVAKHARVFKMVPAVDTLRNNERCHIASGNQEGHFGLHERRGMSSLHFTHPIKHKAIYELTIECEPIDKRKEDIEAFSFTLQLHIV